eukprot:scaffold31649_cov101-Isochrysis_galbana.AAC.2
MKAAASARKAPPDSYFRTTSPHREACASVYWPRKFFSASPASFSAAISRTQSKYVTASRAAPAGTRVAAAATGGRSSASAAASLACTVRNDLV